MKMKFSWVCVLLVLVIAGCSDDLAGDITNIYFSDEEQVVEANNKLTFECLEKIYDENTDSNFVFSPINITLSFSVLQNGCDGATKNEIARFLKHDNLDIDLINNSLMRLLETYQTSEINGLSLNTLFLVDDVEIVDTSYKSLSNYFYNVSFVEKQVVVDSGMYSNLGLDESQFDFISQNENLSDEDFMVIPGFAEFGGRWKYDFRLVSEEMFYDGDDEEIVLDMMETTQQLSYFNDNDLTAVRVPYGDEKYSFIGLIPDESRSLSELVENLSVEKWNNIFSNFASEVVLFSIPEIRTSSVCLVDNLFNNLGYSDIFIENNDFIKINPESISLNSVQCTDFKTVMYGLGHDMAGASYTRELTFNRPFLYFIVQNSTNCIIFAGTYMNPYLNQSL